MPHPHRRSNCGARQEGISRPRTVSNSSSSGRRGKISGRHACHENSDTLADYRAPLFAALGVLIALVLVMILPVAAAAREAGKPICAIDMGSNSFRRMVGSFEHGRYQQRNTEKMTLGVGDDLARHGRISDPKLADIAKVLSAFKAPAKRKASRERSQSARQPSVRPRTGAASLTLPQSSASRWRSQARNASPSLLISSALSVRMVSPSSTTAAGVSSWFHRERRTTLRGLQPGVPHRV